jgi:hypothetical protein
VIQIADVFALSVSDEERYENDVSEHPAESSSNFVDNSVAKALVINRDCIISASPLGENLNAAFGPDIVTGCKKRLIALRNAREPVLVVDSTGRYENMQIMSIVFSRTIKTGDALAFKISLKQLDVITNERTVIQVAIPRAQAKNKKDTKTSKSATEPKPPEDKRSRLRRVVNYLGVDGVSNQPNQGGS